jgi:hypothetical protein
MKFTSVNPISDRNCHKEGIHTDSVRAKVVACDTVHLREFAAMNRADVEKVLPTLPHLKEVHKSAHLPTEITIVGEEATNRMTKRSE